MSEAKASINETMLQHNKMDYRKPKFLVVSTQKTQRVDYFPSTIYNPGQEMVLDISRRDVMIDGLSSTLNFRCEITAGTNQATAGFGQSGSIANVIQTISVFDKQGVELSRTENANLWINQKILWERRSSDLTTIGYASGLANGNDPPVPLAINTYLNFSIPMSEVCPLFNQRNLIPYQLTNGMRIRILLAPSNEAVYGPAGDNVYTISDANITWDMHLLDDEFKNKIDGLSVSSGLYMVYQDIHNERFESSVQTIHHRLTKALSKVSKVHIVNRDSILYDGKVDYMSSSAFNYGNVQARVGTLMFPARPIESTDIQQTLLYMNQLRAWGHIHNKTAPAIAYGFQDYAFGNNVDYKTRASWTVDLSKNIEDYLQGYTINSTRPLIINATLIQHVQPPDNTAKRVDIYVQYLKQLTVYADRCIVKD